MAVVEGTPASSLVKDVNKFFAAKPPKRMAGESVSQPRKIDPRAINTKQPTPKQEYKDPVSDEPTDSKKPVENKRRFTGGSKDFNERTGRVEPGFREETQGRNDRRNKAKDKAESRRKRFFERRRSRKEAERSQTEQEATQGKFITTLGR